MLRDVYRWVWQYLTGTQPQTVSEQWLAAQDVVDDRQGWEGVAWTWPVPTAGAPDKLVRFRQRLRTESAGRPLSLPGRGRPISGRSGAAGATVKLRRTS